MSLGLHITEFLRAKLKENNMTSLGQVNGAILANWIDERFSGWQPPKQKTLRKPTMTDDAYLTELQGEPVAEGLDVRAEFARMSLWCKTNGKQPTRRRFTQWLLRASQNKIMAPRRPETPALPRLEAPPGWVEWVERNIPLVEYRGKPWAQWPEYAQKSVCEQMLAEQLRERSQA